MNAQYDLPDMERLRDVVIRTMLETYHPVEWGTSSRDHNDRDIA